MIIESACLLIPQLKIQVLSIVFAIKCVVTKI